MFKKRHQFRFTGSIKMSFINHPQEDVCMDAENDINIPAEQDSPKHILNALNNFCIRKIFSQIEDVRDYLSAAETCTRFQANAKECFPSTFKTVAFCDDDAFARNKISFGRAKSFLNIFGHSIKSLTFVRSKDQINYNEIFNAIADSCGNTLIELKIHEQILDFNTRSKFKVLEKLELDSSSFHNFHTIPSLKTLRILSNNKPIPMTDWYVRHFPRLEEINFHFLNQLTDTMIIDFIAHNPQLQSIDVNYCHNVSTAIFKNIDKNLPNLERLRFLTWLSSVYFDENMIQLTRLRKLRYLGIEASVSAGALMNSLARNDVPIEELSIEIDSESLIDAPPLKRLKRVDLLCVSDEILIDFVKRHPNLEKVNVSKTTRVTIHGVKKVLECATHLVSASFYIKELHIDLECYKQLLTLVKGRVNVFIFGISGCINVPKDMLAANKEWLKIHTRN